MKVSCYNMDSLDTNDNLQDVYGAITVRLLCQICVVIFVNIIYVKPVKRNISLMNPENTEWFHLKRGCVGPDVKNIPLNNVNITVNNVTFICVCSVFLLENTNIIKKLMCRYIWKI